MKKWLVFDMWHELNDQVCRQKKLKTMKKILKTFRMDVHNTSNRSQHHEHQY